jgi:hypothetical protein
MLWPTILYVALGAWIIAILAAAFLCRNRTMAWRFGAIFHTFCVTFFGMIVASVIGFVLITFLTAMSSPNLPSKSFIEISYYVAVGLTAFIISGFFALGDFESDRYEIAT